MFTRWWEANVRAFLAGWTACLASGPPRPPNLGEIVRAAANFPAPENTTASWLGVMDAVDYSEVLIMCSFAYRPIHSQIVRPAVIFHPLVDKIKVIIFSF